MFTKKIVFFGQERILACDGKCNKAWGINSRDKIHFDKESDYDDYAYYADHEVGEAPICPGTWEGGHGKPINAKSGDDMNKWCARECERSVMEGLHKPITLRDFTQRLYNDPSKHLSPVEQEPVIRIDKPMMEVTFQFSEITVVDGEEE